MNFFPAPASTAVLPPPPPAPPPTARDGSATSTRDATSAPAADHLRLFAEAGRRARPVRRAAGVARASGWLMLTFAIITLVTGIFSIRAAALGLALLLAALIELRGARRLRAFSAAAATTLAINQLAVGAALILYAVTALAGVWHGPSPYESYLTQDGQIAEMIKPIAQLHRAASMALYGALIAGVLIAQPCLACYYRSRRAKIAAYEQQTPRWVAKALEAAEL